MLNVIDEFARECIAIQIDLNLNSTNVIDVLSDAFFLCGVSMFVWTELAREIWTAGAGGFSA